MHDRNSDAVNTGVAPAEAGRQGLTVGSQQENEERNNREKPAGLLAQGKQIMWQRGSAGSQRKRSQVLMIVNQRWGATNWKKPNRGKLQGGT